MTRSLLILLFLCCGALAGDGVNFAGSWDAPVNNVSAFSLDTHPDRKSHMGYHTAIAHRGKRIDSVLPDKRDDRPLLVHYWRCCPRPIPKRLR